MFYDSDEINTNINLKNDLNQVILLFAKHVHFTIENQTYLHRYGVVIGSPHCSILSDVFMVELERTLLPTRDEHVKD